MKIKYPDDRTWLKGLAVECPLGKALPCCPLNGLRNLPTLQIKHIVGQLSDQQVNAAIKSHQHCFEERVKILQKSSHRHVRKMEVRDEPGTSD